MRMSFRSLRALAVGIAIAGVLALSACDSGGPEGGAGSPSVFTFTGAANFVFQTGAGAETTISFPTLPVPPLPGQDPIPLQPGGTPTVPGLIVPSGNVAGVVRQDFIELSFSSRVIRSSVRSATGGLDGIVLTREDPVTRLQLFVDFSVQVADADGTLPPTFRIFPDSDGSLAAPNLNTLETFPDGAYSLRITNALRGSNNGASLPFTNSPGNAPNDFTPELSFAIGADNVPLTLRTSPTQICVAGGATQPLSGDASMPLNTEVTLDFNKAVAFETLVGAANLTTLDPFITVPLPLASPLNGCNAAGMAMDAFGVDFGDLYVGIRAPLDPTTGQADPPPPNLAVIVYMPDPISRPSRVRVRFVDNTNLVGTETLPNGPFQNYASNSARSELRILTNDPARIAAAQNSGQPRPVLGLPPRLSLSGSLPSYVPSGNFLADTQAMLLEIVVAGAMTADPTGLGCSVPTGTLVSRTGQAFDFCPVSPNPLVDFYFLSAFQPGVALARNPGVPDLTIAIQPSEPGLAAINSAGITTPICGGGPNPQDTTAPVRAGGQLVGGIALAPNSLRSPNVLGTPLDVEIGGAISGFGNLFNNHRRNTTTLGVPDTQNGLATDSLFNILFGNGCGGPVAPLPQPYGNFLYVVDGDRNELRIFNSYNFTPISTIPGVRSPAGLGMDAGLQRLYVSNFGDGTIQVVDIVQASPTVNTVIGTVGVGNGPRAVSVMGLNEAVFVANFSDNTVSRVNPSSLTVVETYRDPSMIGPEDIFAAERMLCMGCTLAFSTFVPNSVSNSVIIIESESFAVPENGPTGTIKGVRTGFQTPRGGTWNWFNQVALVPNARGPGAIFANSTGTTVTELAMTNFTLSPMIGFPGPPGIRTYNNIQTIQPPGNANIPATANPSDITIDVLASVAAANLPPQGGGSPSKAFRDGGGGNNPPLAYLITYPGFGQVSAVNPFGGIHLSQITVPGAQFLQSYYDQ